MLPGNKVPVKIKDAPIGILGVFRSKNQAKIVGKKWLYSQLFRLSDTISLPIPRYRHDEYDMSYQQPLPWTWRRSGDETSGWDNGTYSVTDLGRDVANSDELVTLSVSIEERVVDQVDDEEEYETDAEDDEAEEDDG